MLSVRLSFVRSVVSNQSCSNRHDSSWSIMYDFCFSPIYAVVLALGGVMGYITKGSLVSLGAGVGSAAVLALCSQLSLSSYHAGKTCKPATAVSLLVAAALTYTMYQRYTQSQKLMPAGITAGISAAMTVFYVWSLLLGPTPTLKAKAA